MKGDPIPDPDHILRYVGGTHVDEDDLGNKVPLGSGFIAKPKDDNRPSYNWLECLEGSIEDQVQAVRDVARVKYGAKAVLARLNVGQVRSYIAENTDENLEVAVVHDPLEQMGDWPPDPSHSVMAEVPDEDSPLGEFIGDLVSQCVLDVFPARKT